MDIEWFRDYCLSMEGVTEKTPFGRFSRRFDSVLVFYVLNHMFCLIDINDFSSISVRSTPEEIGNLQGRYQSVVSPDNSALRFWIKIELNGDMPDSEVCLLAERAYNIVKEKYTPRPRRKKQ